MLNPIKLTKGDIRKRTQAIRITNSKPCFLHSLLAMSIAPTMEGTENRRMIEFVCEVTFVP